MVVKLLPKLILLAIGRNGGQPLQTGRQMGEDRAAGRVVKPLHVALGRSEVTNKRKKEDADRDTGHEEVGEDESDEPQHDDNLRHVLSKLLHNEGQPLLVGKHH